LGDKPLVDTVLQMAIDTGLAAFKRQQTAIMARPDNRPLLSRISCPSLVLVGREDALTPPAMAQERDSRSSRSAATFPPWSDRRSSTEPCAPGSRPSTPRQRFFPFLLHLLLSQLFHLLLSQLSSPNYPLATTPLATIPLATIPLATIPLATIPLATIPLATTPLATTPLATSAPARRRSPHR
jgi:hypothetical protein